MFEFTLSKINMLIFVTAIAVIVVFFMNSLNDNLKTKQGFELAYKTGKEVKALVDGGSTCSVKFIEVPKYLKIKENTQTGITYKLAIQTYDQMPQNLFVLYLTDDKEKKIYGAYKLDYKGNFNFYESTYENGVYQYQKIEENNVFYEPRKANSNEERFLLMKHKVDEDINYYIIPCAKKHGNRDTCKQYVCDNFYENEIKLNCLKSFCDMQAQD